MAIITLRNEKGSALTIAEMDANFVNLNTDIQTRLPIESFNGEEILSRQLTVDGTGSGLDADTVDGFSTSVAATGGTILVRDVAGGITANTGTFNSSVTATSITLTNNLIVGGQASIGSNLTVNGNLIVNGTSTSVNTSVVTVEDPIIEIGGGDNGSAPISNDGKDRGIVFRYHNGTTAKTGFFGYDANVGRFVHIPDATIVGEVASGATLPLVYPDETIQITRLGVGVSPDANFSIKAIGAVSAASLSLNQGNPTERLEIGSGSVRTTGDGHGLKLSNTAGNGGGSIVALNGANAGLTISSNNGPLNVSHSQYFKSQSNTNQSHIHIVNASTGTTLTDGLMIGNESSGKAVIKNLENAGVSIFTNNTEAVIVDQTQNVGIGITPSRKLHVNGLIKSEVGGIEFPDGSIQTTAAGGTQPNFALQNADIASTSFTTAATGQQVIDTISSTNFRTVNYLVQVFASGSYHSTNLTIVHDGVDAYMSEYGTIITMTTLGTFSADINGGLLRLLFDPVFANSTVKTVRTSIKA